MHKTCTITDNQVEMAPTTEDSYSMCIYLLGHHSHAVADPGKGTGVQFIEREVRAVKSARSDGVTPTSKTTILSQGKSHFRLA